MGFLLVLMWLGWWDICGFVGLRLYWFIFLICILCCILYAALVDVVLSERRGTNDLNKLNSIHSISYYCPQELYFVI